jgi:hypothetical protein
MVKVSILCVTVNQSTRETLEMISHTVMEKFYMKIMILILEVLRKVKKMEKVNFYIFRQKIATRENLEKINEQDSAQWFIKMVIDMKENGYAIKKTGEENIPINKLRTYMKVTGSMIGSMVRDPTNSGILYFPIID